MMTEDETNITTQVSIKELFVASFKKLYERRKNEEHISHTDNLLNGLPILSNDHIDILARPFSKEEIKIAAFISKPLKSPGPYGIPSSFIQQNWQTIYDKVLLDSS